MILTCPSCRTRYQTDVARFVPAGRNVRCAKCGQVWFQPAPDAESIAEEAIEPVAEEPAAAAVAPPVSAAPALAPMVSDLGALDFNAPRQAAEPEPAPSRKPVAAAKPRRRIAINPAHVVGWAALILVVGGIGWSATQYRQTVANLWPQSASLYAALGMPVNVRGMALVNIAYQQDFENGQPVLSVTGKVVNISDRELPVPGLRVVLTDDSKHELYHWTFDVGVPTLKAGAESDFVTRLSSPPPEARNLNISFSEAGLRE